MGQQPLDCRVCPSSSICMKNVLIIGHTGGIGRALADYYTVQGAQVTGVSRTTHGLDYMNPASVDAAMAQIEGPFDRVIVASGALEIDSYAPEKTIQAVTAQGMADQFAVNAVGPALILKHIKRLCPRRAPAVVAVLSARVGSIGDNNIGGWISYRAAKAAVNQIIRTSAIELGRTHPELALIALHPGTVATKFSANYTASHPTQTPENAAQHMAQVIEAMTPQNTGQFFDWAGKSIEW